MSGRKERRWELEVVHNPGELYGWERPAQDDGRRVKFTDAGKEDGREAAAPEEREEIKYGQPLA